MMRNFNLALAAAAALLCLGRVPAQDAAKGALALKDGRFVFGKPIKKVEGGVEVHFDCATVFVPKDLIRDYFSTGTGIEYEPEDAAEAKKLEHGLVPFNGVWMSRSRAEKKLASLQEELQAKLSSQKERKRWMNRTRVETKYFDFEYNVPDELFERLEEMLDVYYKYFTRYWGKKTKLAHKPTIHIYADYEDFKQISGATDGILGYYHPGSNKLHIFWDRTDPEYTVDVLFHEANHMLADMIDGRFRYPHWIEEPMAEYYGASDWDPVKKKMTTGRIQAGRLAEIKGDIDKGKWWTLHQLIYSPSYRSYTWGWSFVYFMMETPAYSKRWKKFYLDLAHKDGIRRKTEGEVQIVEPDEQVELLLKYTHHKSLESLEKEWHEFVKNLDVQSVEGYERAGRKLRTMGKHAEARKYLEQAVSMGAKNPHTFAALSDVLAAEGEVAEALEMIDRALKVDPLEPEFYYAKGKLLSRPGSRHDEGKAKDCFRLAVEIEPDSWRYATALAELDG